MNPTIEQQDPTNLTELSGELLMVAPEPKKGRAAPCEFDEKYIQAFVAEPHLGKHAAYIKATGSSTSYGRQRANELHNRLESRINEALRQRVLSCVNYGMGVLYELAGTADSQAVRAGAASKLIELGLRVAPPTPQKIEIRTREQILIDIQQTKDRINKMQIGMTV